MTIGIIGQGYVGTAIKLGFQEHYKIETYDKFDLAKSTRSNVKDIVELISKKEKVPKKIIYNFCIKNKK